MSFLSYEDRRSFIPSQGEGNTHDPHKDGIAQGRRTEHFHFRAFNET